MRKPARRQHEPSALRIGPEPFLPDDIAPGAAAPGPEAIASTLGAVVAVGLQPGITARSAGAGEGADAHVIHRELPAAAALHEIEMGCVPRRAAVAGVVNEHAQEAAPGPRDRFLLGSRAAAVALLLPPP